MFLCEACTGMVSFRSHLRKVRRGYLANVSGRIMKTLKKRDLSSQNTRLWRATSMASLSTRTVCQLSLPIPRFKVIGEDLTTYETHNWQQYTTVRFRYQHFQCGGAQKCAEPTVRSCIFPWQSAEVKPESDLHRFHRWHQML